MPISQLIWLFSPKNTAPAVTSAPPTNQTVVITRSTSMPVEAARSLLSATARIALPIFVLRSATAVPMRRNNPITMIRSSLGRTSIGPIENTGSVCTAYCS